MTRLTIKQRNFLMIVVLIVLISGIGILVIFPSVRGILTLQYDIATTHSQLDQELQRTKRLRRSLSEFHIIKAGTKRFAAVTIKPNEALRVIDEMETIAPQLGISQTVSVDIKDKKEPAEYIFSFVNQGTLEQHLAYLKALESLPYYVIIDQLAWNVVSGENPEELLTLRFNATVYEDTFTIE